MKKIIALMLSLMCIMSLTACGNKDVDADVKVPEETVESTPAEDTTENNDYNGAFEEEEIDKEETDPSIINTLYFKMKLPESWQETCAYQIKENGSFTAYEKVGKESHGCGKLFSIEIIPQEQDYTMYPDYDVLGTIETAQGKCTVIVVYPTDVQFVSETAKTYQAMQNDIAGIIEEIQFKDTAKFAKQ
jgi:predicted small lipoprotein YifL